MYYLVINTNQIKIVDACELHEHRDIIFHNYCANNNIIHVSNRQEINKKCRKSGLYTYKVNDHDYIVLDCKYHPSNYLFNEYVEKHTLYHLNFVYFVKSEKSVLNVVKDICNFDKNILTPPKTAEEWEAIKKAKKEAEQSKKALECYDSDESIDEMAHRYPFN